MSIYVKNWLEIIETFFLSILSYYYHYKTESIRVEMVQL